MSKQIYTVEQIALLQAHPCVESCSERYIWYDPTFKVRAVQRYKEGYCPQEIFLEAGFDLSLVGKKKIKECLSRWRRKHRERGDAGLRENPRKHKGRPKEKWDTPEEENVWLKAKVAYLKTENDFLKKLRAKRAE